MRLSILPSLLAGYALLCAPAETQLLGGLFRGRTTTSSTTSRGLLGALLGLAATPTPTPTTSRGLLGGFLGIGANPTPTRSTTSRGLLGGFLGFGALPTPTRSTTSRGLLGALLSYAATPAPTGIASVPRASGSSTTSPRSTSTSRSGSGLFGGLVGGRTGGSPSPGFLGGSLTPSTGIGGGIVSGITSLVGGIVGLSTGGILSSFTGGSFTGGSFTGGNRGGVSGPSPSSSRNATGGGLSSFLAALGRLNRTGSSGPTTFSTEPDTPFDIQGPMSGKGFRPPMMHPSTGPTWQIILSGVPDLRENALSIVPDVDVYDIDLFATEKRVIDTLIRMNKTVMCYFSAGTYEDFRPDKNQFRAADIGSQLPLWPDEKWLRLSSNTVRRIMANRIQLASQKGCHAIDPDNLDGFSARGEGGLRLTRRDSINFVQFLSRAAAKYNLFVGLKNSLEILSDVKDIVDFAVNEECVSARECDKYRSFTNKDKKPVFHIEYPVYRPAVVSEAQRKMWCAESITDIGKHPYFQTVLKVRKLDGWVTYCNGTMVTTPTKIFNNRYSGLSRRGMLEEHGRSIRVAGPSHKERLALIANNDGYPFPPGMGSEKVLSDEELGGYRQPDWYVPKSESTSSAEPKSQLPLPPHPTTLQPQIKPPPPRPYPRDAEPSVPP